ncbi:unnamed protein product, partial [Discosporangium mesarthrocarpum]
MTRMGFFPRGGPSELHGSVELSCCGRWFVGDWEDEGNGMCSPSFSERVLFPSPPLSIVISDFLKIVYTPTKTPSNMFRRYEQVTNPLNEDLPVLRSRDGQELAFETGRKLMMLVWAQPEIHLPEEVTNTAKHFTGLDAGAGHGRPPGSAVGGGGGWSKPQDRPPGPPSWMGGEPGRPGFLFDINPQIFDECLGKLLFGLPRLLPPGAKESVVPGAALFLLDSTRGLIFGLFTAASPLTEGIDRHAWARAGQETPLPWQVKVVVDLEAPPLQAGDPAVVSAFFGGPVVPGALDPETTNQLCAIMASRCPPPPGFMGPPGPMLPGGGGAVPGPGPGAGNMFGGRGRPGRGGGPG